MKLKRLWDLSVGVMGLAFGMICQAQSVLITPQVLQDLNSDRWQVRRDAFEHLAGVRNGVNQSRIQKLLIQLRQREDQESEKADPDLFEDDDYLAYDEELTSLVQKIAVDANDAGAWRSLVYMRYNGDSDYGNWIASHRQCLPYLLDQIHSPYSGRRLVAVYVLASMLAKSKFSDPFSPTRYKSLKARIRELAAKDVVPVRFSAVQGLGLINDPEDTDFVYQICEGFSDPHLRALALGIAQKMSRTNQRNRPPSRGLNPVD